MMHVALALTLAAGAQWLGPPVKPPERVRRVISLAPSLTETLVALDATSRVIAVSRFDELPEVASLPRVGGYSDVAVERVVALEPDLVVVQKSPGNQKSVETLARLGITALALPLTSVADVVDAIQVLGRVVGKAKEAEALAARLTETRARLRAAAKASGAAPVVLLVYGFSPLVVAGPGSFAHELLADCGARNAIDVAPTPYPTVPLEQALALAPAVVIDASDTVEGRDAVRRVLGKARWVALPTKDLLHPGPALVRGVEQLCALLTPTTSSR